MAVQTYPYPEDIPLERQELPRIPYKLDQTSVINSLQDPFINEHSLTPLGNPIKKTGLTGDNKTSDIRGQIWNDIYRLWPEGKPSKEKAPDNQMLSLPEVIDYKLKEYEEKGVEPLKTYAAIPGTIVRALIEFPEWKRGKKNGESIFIDIDDAISIAYSVYRSKAPVNLLGKNSVSGYAIGSKTVAGTLIRSVFFEDNLTEFQNKCYAMDQKEIAERLAGVNSKIPKGSVNKEELSVMKDDLTVFNIHCAIISEEEDGVVYESYINRTPRMRYESILGCVVINNGQVYSIQDLITENTLSFQAKTVRTSTNLEDFSFGFSTSPARKSVTEIMNG